MGTVRLTDEDYVALAEFRYRLRRFFAFSEEQARAAGLNPQQHQLLLAVRGALEAPTVGDLAERLALRHHSTVELIDRLEARGLVRRRRAAEDLRQAHVALTARGEAALAKLSIAHRDELRRVAPELIAALASLRTAKRKAAIR
ncbi:MAG TPA: MarR family transcriptional regulator [Planctomycetota bacterium]|nr:MarR family transcriptional regulator [Planctomycetota bacterium]